MCVFLEDTEVYGHKVSNGKVSSSDHIIPFLSTTTPDLLVTVRPVNSWKGLYKTLIHHFPNLTSLVANIDAACAGQLSASRFEWSAPGVLAAFNAATRHLSKVMAM